MEVELRNLFQHECAKDLVSSMLARYGKIVKGNHTISAVVLNYPICEQWTGGSSDIGYCLQIPSCFYKPTGRGAHICASYETLKSTYINLDYLCHDSDNQGPAWWYDYGSKHLKIPLFTADIFAYGGKHNSYVEIWMIDGINIVSDDIIHELISWHHSNSIYITLNCISSEFVLSQDKNMEPSKFMQLCRDNSVKKVPEYIPQVKTERTYTRETVDIPGGMDIRGFFKSAKPQ